MTAIEMLLLLLFFIHEHDIYCCRQVKSIVWILCKFYDPIYMEFFLNITENDVLLLMLFVMNLNKILLAKLNK